MSETGTLIRTTENGTLDSPATLTHSSLAVIPGETQGLLLRMFADPRVLTKEESAGLVKGLREAVAKQPRSSELRVLLGMALCVALEAQEAMEELGEAVRLSPDSFIAHLKMGELWMRLRVMDKAEDHTRQAAVLAGSLAQSELARRQATMIRTIQREGIERCGYRTPFLSLSRLKRVWTKIRNRGSEEGLEGGQNEELDTVGAQ